MTPCWTCRECDSICNAHYFTKRDGSTWFGGWKCVECGRVEPPALGIMKVKDDKRLPR